jgi:hypothetical protein
VKKTNAIRRAKRAKIIAILMQLLVKLKQQQTTQQFGKNRVEDVAI